MNGKDVKVLSLSLILNSIIFLLDYYFSLGAISILYILFMFTITFISKESKHIIFSIIVSTVLTFIGWGFQTGYAGVEIDLGIIHAIVDYEGLFRAFSLFIIVVVGGILLEKINKEKEVSRLKTNIELSILARTTTSETRARKLENQIKVLKEIRESETIESLKRLDDVIEVLKVISSMETKDDATKE